MKMSNIIKQFTELNISKESANNAEQAAINAINNGEISAKKVLTLSKYFEELGKALYSKEIIDLAIQDGEKSRESGVKYDYSKSEAYNAAKELLDVVSAPYILQLDEVKAQARRSKPSKYNVVDFRTGEMQELEILPAIKTSKTIVPRTLNKE